MTTFLRPILVAMWGWAPELTREQLDEMLTANAGLL